MEQRCRQYDEQMQIVVAAFEQAAGSGSAGAYTQLALKTILKQFGGLKSRICAQIKGGDDESRVDKAGWRLKFVGNNAWRPQRGLPERAVSLLRAWLFQHFLHPYILSFISISSPLCLILTVVLNYMQLPQGLG